MADFKNDNHANMTTNAVPPRPMSTLRDQILNAPMPSVTNTMIVLLCFMAILTKMLSGRSSEKINGINAQSTWMPSYWLPVIGHLLPVAYDPNNFMAWASKQSVHGIFSLYLGAHTFNVITNPALVKSALAQKESSVSFTTIAWRLSKRLFGLYQSVDELQNLVTNSEMEQTHMYLMKETHLGNMLRTTVRELERIIPQMISFMPSPVDQQPWEGWAKACLVSEQETDVDLMALVRDLLGHASVPALFGRALLENNPHLLHDVYEMDAGIPFFLMRLPIWTPWWPVIKAHWARKQVWDALAAFHKAQDDASCGKKTDRKWGDMDDVSPYIQKRNSIMRDHGIRYWQRLDITVLWALIANANLMVYWHLLHILASPGLLPRILAEIAPYAYVSAPEKILKISSAPALTLDYEGLSRSCPLFRSTFLEASRLSSQPWSIRQITNDVVISGGGQPVSDSTSHSTHNAYFLRKGEAITIPHNTHTMDPAYFANPQSFDPARFLVTKEDGSTGTNMGTIRPFGGGHSMCKGRVLAEKECLALVAGVLVFWEFEPVGKRGERVERWTVPGQVKGTAVSRPVHDTRVRVRRRVFEWEKVGK